jgi:N-methylhydantoinase B
VIPAGEASDRSAARCRRPSSRHGTSFPSSSAGGRFGARPDRDGGSAVFSGFHGDTFSCPAEVAEARYSTVDRLALDDGPGGEGEHRGGKGIVLEYRVRSNGCFFTCAYTRNKHKPWALADGFEGSPNYAEVIRADGTVETHAVVTALEVNENDVIRIHTGNGGGYGDPRNRPRENVLDDLKNGFVTAARAAAVYGVEA